MFWLLILTLIGVLAYFYVVKPLSYWKDNKVSQKPVLEVINGILGTLLLKAPLAKTSQELYNYFPGKRYFGTYSLDGKLLMLKDVDLIKQITVKDFDHFMDHKPFFSVKDEPLWNNNLFSLKGDKWKLMRSTLSPSFTSSKMKVLSELMLQCAENFVAHFENDPSIAGKEIDLLDVITRYTNDVIATTVFGIKCDSLKEPNNEFYSIGKDLTSIFNGKLSSIKLMSFIFLPKITKLLNIKFFSDRATVFFRSLVTNSIKVRKEKNIVRQDVINLLMEARKGKSKDISANLPETGFAVAKDYTATNDSKNLMTLTDLEITVHAVGFFFAGFETVSKSMCFILHEMTTNPDVQAKLQQEIDDTLNEGDGKITYESLAKMKYLDAVVTEGLRMWPIALTLNRQCMKPYVIKPEHPNEIPVHLNKGDVISVAVFAMHRDPQHYPDPDRFDPERFSDENKKNINQYTYLPFGIGPRNCIGSRFALLEMKILLFHLFSKFDLVPTAKTQIPLKLSKGFSLNPENGFYLGFKPRENCSSY